MSKWIGTITLASVFFFFPVTELHVSALVWGVVLARYVANRYLFMALMICGLLLAYVFVPPRLYSPLIKVALVGFCLGGMFFGVRFALAQLFADDTEVVRQRLRLQTILRESIGQAAMLSPGSSTEIFFSRHEDHFAEAVASRYRSVGWAAVVYHVPTYGTFGGDNVVVITAPESHQEIQTSLTIMEFMMD